MASLMRRTLVRTRAPIFKSLRRIVPQLARANWVCCRATRRRAQSADQYIGHRSEPQSQLVGAHRLGRGAVGEQVELAFLDAVLHVAAGAVDLLVEMTGLVCGTRQGGHDKARVGVAAGPFGLAE